MSNGKQKFSLRSLTVDVAIGILLTFAMIGSSLIVARAFNYRLKPGSFPRITFEKFEEIAIGAKAMSEEKCRIDTLPLDSPEVEAMRKANQATEQLTSSDGLWVMMFPAGDEACKQAVTEVLQHLSDGKVTATLIPDNCILMPATVNGPYFTWDVQTIPPTREYDLDRDGPYPVVQVHNSQSPGLKKQGRLIRPVTKPDADLAIWEVDIEGEVVVVHDPEEAWMGAGQ